MIRTHVTVTVTRTVQIKQYEPVTVAISETAELEDNEDHGKAKSELYKGIYPRIEKMINHQIESAQEK